MNEGKSPGEVGALAGCSPSLSPPRPPYTHHAGLLLVSETEISKLYSGPKLPAGSGSWLIVSVAQIRLGWGAAGGGSAIVTVAV